MCQRQGPVIGGSYALPMQYAAEAQAAFLVVLRVDKRWTYPSHSQHHTRPVGERSA